MDNGVQVTSRPIPFGLRVRRRWRRLAPVRAYSVLRQVVTHPANQGTRLAAVARAVRWQLRSRLSPRPVDVPVFDGLTMRCYSRSNAASNVIYFTERHDPIEMAVLSAWLRPGDVAADVGANIGTYTLLFAHLVGDRGRVIAAEPGRKAADRLRENVELNQLRQVSVIESAVGRVAGRAQMTATRDVSNTLAPGPGSYAIHEVDVVTLDDLLDGLPARAVKIDVEGFEAEVLAGADAALAARPLLVVEATDHLLRRAGTSASSLMEMLEERGFLLRYPREGGVEELTSTRPESLTNLVAVPHEQWDEFADRMRRAHIDPGGGPR